MKSYDWTGAFLISLPYIILFLIILATIAVAIYTIPTP